ncbi:MAG: type I restriction enzyme, S subunit [Candidatus Kentron sp. G]|nr:MAG: type I restriction enzyme, S subunit [Candidatus Kentron sp. G]VFN00611.1 MAG: type I restriction enzyme, S subunit [Candidatus Kentron sp. G]VFN02555.1 MAG: type I restriction enzyme, S subunit [Candidatus Kentron sp. G]
MMDTLLTVPLSNLMDIKHGYPFSSRYFVHEPTEYILLTARNFTKDQRISFGENTTYYDGPVPDGFILDDGDLLLVMTDLKKEMGILGKAAVLRRDQLDKRFSNKMILHNQRIGKVIRKDPRSRQTFLMYLLNSDAVHKEIKATATSTTVHHTSPGKILNVRVWAPRIWEQERIAAILSEWDRSIYLSERLIAANQQKRVALARKLLSGKKRFSAFSRVDWDYPRIGEIARHIIERNSGNGRDDAPLPVLSCTKYNGLVDSSSYFGKQVFSKNLSSYKVVRRGGFAYATNHIEEGSIGYQNLYDKALVSPMYTVFETSDRILDEFLYLVLKTSRYRHIFAANTNASVNRRGSLRWKEFAGIRVPLPPREEQETLVRFFSVIDREISLLGKQQLALSRQKKGLMQKLIGGQWRV